MIKNYEQMITKMQALLDYEIDRYAALSEFDNETRDESARRIGDLRKELNALVEAREKCAQQQHDNFILERKMLKEFESASADRRLREREIARQELADSMLHRDRKVEHALKIAELIVMGLIPPAVGWVMYGTGLKFEENGVLGSRFFTMMLNKIIKPK